MTNFAGLAVVFAIGAAACGGGSSGGDPDASAPDAARPGFEIGTGDHTPGSVDFTVIASDADQLWQPRDLAFNPRVPDDLWIVDFATDATVIVHAASTSARQSEFRRDAYALHFMAEVTAIAFGADETTIPFPGTFATCGESRNTYNDTEPPNDFMGPTLWSSALEVYAVVDPNGLGSHLDMLHCSPLCMGIAHEQANVYWAFNGLGGSIVKYDFAVDDGIGHDDHSDGKAYDYAAGQVARVAGVPSGLAFDAASAFLYVADSGNARLARLDTTSGTRGAALVPFEPMDEYVAMEGAVLEDVVPAASGLLEVPAGVELHRDLLFVSDNGNSRISAFTPDGERVNWLDTGLAGGSLGGMAFGPDGKLYFVDIKGARVLRIEP